MSVEGGKYSITATSAPVRTVFWDEIRRPNSGFDLKDDITRIALNFLSEERNPFNHLATLQSLLTISADHDPDHAYVGSTHRDTSIRWRDALQGPAELEALLDTVELYPPVGGKIPLIFLEKLSGIDARHHRFYPTVFAEQQCQAVSEFIKKLRPLEGYVHQLSVQGRLPDRIKFAGIGLVLSSPHQNDWNEPFFSPDIGGWGSVAPLVHDGGLENATLPVSPTWVYGIGRTDFMQRIVHLPTDQTPEGSLIRKAEGKRMSYELKAYQRLALALHATLGNGPFRESDPNQRLRLSRAWNRYEFAIKSLLKEYGLDQAANPRWFLTTARPLWNKSYLERFEADYPPIREQLMRLEEAKAQSPALRVRAIELLRDTTYEVDSITGLGKYLKGDS